MNTSKTIFLIITGIIAIAISLLIIQLLLKKLKPKSEIETRLKVSYGIWFSTLFISASIINFRMISVFSEAVDNIYKMKTTNAIGETAQVAVIFIGLAAVWLLIWFFISKFLAVVIVGKRIDANEMAVDNYAYFLIKGILLIGFILCLLPIFETLLRGFMPAIILPFYH